MRENAKPPKNYRVQHSATIVKRKAVPYTSPYPDLDEIDRASRTRLAYWLRYLPSPGEAAIGSLAFGDALATESAKLDLINERFEKGGGWTPWLSKAADRLHEGKN